MTDRRNMLLSKIVSKLPSSIVYRVINTRVGRQFYSYQFTDTEAVSVQCGDLSFEMRAPQSDLLLWDDFVRTGCHEPVTTDAMVAELRANQKATVWDIGSKCGYFMMVAAQVVSPDRIHVFDPMDAHIAVIRENNKYYLNEKAYINHIKIGNSAEGDTISGDEYASDHKPPDLVKIDVDGPELSVLRGMEEILKNITPALLIEIHVSDNWKQKVREFETLFSEFPYRYLLSENHRDQGEDWRQLDALDELKGIQNEINDFLVGCIPKDREEQTSW